LHVLKLFCFLENTVDSCYLQARLEDVFFFPGSKFQNILFIASIKECQQAYSCFWSKSRTKKYFLQRNSSESSQIVKFYRFSNNSMKI